MVLIMQKTINIPKWSDLIISIKKNEIILENKTGKITLNKTSNVLVTYNNNILILSITKEKDFKYLNSLYSLINNKLLDLHLGFFTFFKIKGVNFRLQLVENKLNFSLGYSHACILTIPENISVKPYPNVKETYIVSGNDRNVIKNFVNKIQKLKIPNTYTGNGILLENQKIKLKQGKKK